MRFKLSAGLLSLAAAAGLAPSPLVRSAAPRPARQEQQQQQQQDEQDVTDSFVTTRGAGFGDRTKKPAPASTSTGKSTGASAGTPPKKTGLSGKFAKKENKGGNKTNTAQGMTDADPNRVNTAATNAPDNNSKTMATPGKTLDGHGAQHANNPADGPRLDDTAAAAPGGALGLGYTLLLVGDDGSNTVVESSRAFTSGEKIRIALETNADGFLYIFNAENDSSDAVMLYPHAAVDSGANRIAAHARDFFPADLRYSFIFDQTTATEHVYVIFSRRPLAEVPAGAALLEYCGAQKPDDCFWQPTREQWARLKAAAASGRVVESTNKDLAAAKTQLPPTTLSRGIKVQKNEPAPAVVRMNASAAADVLLTKIQLIHR